MILWTCTRVTLMVLVLLGAGPIVFGEEPLPGAAAGETPLRFGPPTHWPELLSPRGLLVQAPPPPGKGAEAGSKPGSAVGSVCYTAFALEFKNVAARKQFEAYSWPKVSAFDRFLEVFVAQSDLPRFKDQTRAFKGLVWMDNLLSGFTPPLPVPTPGQSRALPRKHEPIVRGGYRGLTGKGVVLAIVDLGVDFRNPDFITQDASGRPVSRLLYLWDTRSQAFDQGRGGSRPPMSFPNGASIGTLYTQAQLTAELRASTPAIPSTDLDGHGTACASIAAGNGRNGPDRWEVRGVAPEADLIAVCVNGDGFAFLLNAIVDWLDQVRGIRPVVISHSMGAQFGGHDGLLVHERALSARFPLKSRGRALVISAGNEGISDSHAVLNLGAAGGLLSLAWKVPERGALLRLYADVPSPDHLRIVNRSGQTVDPARVSWSPYRDSGQILIQAFLKHPGVLHFASQTGRPIRIDAYVGESQYASNGSFSTGVVREALVGSPGTTEHAITVGAYMWNEQFDYQGKASTMKDICDDTPLRIGDIACYSSPGFSRSGGVKPDLAAPADYFMASRAKTADGKDLSNREVTDTSGRYIPFNGTSAATPYTAGVIALLFQKNPRLDLGTLRSLLATQVTRDGFTGTTPNPRWGHGKLDLAAIDRLIDAVR